MIKICKKCDIYTAMTINGNFSQSEVMQMASLTSHEFIENAFANLISIMNITLDLIYYTILYESLLSENILSRL